jgi:hypothetical protein
MEFRLPPSPPIQGALRRRRQFAWAALPAMIMGYFVGVGLAQTLPAQNQLQPVSQTAPQGDLSVSSEGEPQKAHRETQGARDGERLTRRAVEQRLASTDPRNWLQSFGAVTEKPLTNR